MISYSRSGVGAAPVVAVGEFLVIPDQVQGLRLPLRRIGADSKPWAATREQDLAVSPSTLPTVSSLSLLAPEFALERVRSALKHLTHNMGRDQLHVAGRPR